jgi:hypothetical protein
MHGVLRALDAAVVQVQRRQSLSHFLSESKTENIIDQDPLMRRVTRVEL